MIIRNDINMVFNTYILIVIAVIITLSFLYIYYRYIDDYDKNIDTIIEDTHNLPAPEDLSEFCMHQILSDKQAAVFAKKVKNDQKNWKSKNMLMSILGTASYLEGTRGYNYYQSQYKKTNVHLNKNYSELYDIVLDYFQKRTPNSRVAYRFAKPGFHIFKCNKIFSYPVASIHKDRQYRHLKFDKKEDIDYDKTVSFTLCLELPPTGGGLFVFENDNKKTKINYKPGYIVCHNGKTTHMIAPSPKPKDNKDYYRITLQGHAVYDKNANTWWLYW